MGVQVSSNDLFDLFKFMEEANLSIEDVIDFCKKEAAKVAARNGKSFVLEVDCQKTFSEMIRDGKYSHVDDDVDEQNFPLPVDFVGQKIQLEAKLFHFGFAISSQDAILEMEKAGYRPANSVELLSFIISNQKYWKEKAHIIALGAFFVDEFKEKHILRVDFDDSEVILDIDVDYSHDNWNDKCWFLAIKQGA